MRRLSLAVALISAVANVSCNSAGRTGPNVADVRVPEVRAQVTKAGSFVLPPLPTNPELLPPLPSGNVVHVDLVLLDREVEIAPDMHYRAWTFNGAVPGPVIHAKVGDTIDVTLTNKAIMGHSIDFHAALAPPNVAYQTVQPGHTLHFSWVAAYPGAFMYHCGTPPVLAHISNGMYGEIVIDPKDGWGGDAQDYVFVQSEFYPTLMPGSHDDYFGDLAKMKSATAEVVTFNGLAFRYRNDPLPIKVGKLVRVFVVDAGPNHFSAFHVIGSIFSRVLADGDPANVTTGVQTIAIPPGGGAVGEFTVQQAGMYPFLTHSFGDTDAGGMGLFQATD